MRQIWPGSNGWRTKRPLGTPLVAAFLGAGLDAALTAGFLAAPLVAGFLGAGLEPATGLRLIFLIAHHLRNHSIKPVKSQCNCQGGGRDKMLRRRADFQSVQKGTAGQKKV